VILIGLNDVDMILEVDGVKEANDMITMGVVIVMSPRERDATTVARQDILRERF